MLAKAFFLLAAVDFLCLALHLFESTTKINWDEIGFCLIAFGLLFNGITWIDAFFASRRIP